MRFAERCRARALDKALKRDLSFHLTGVYGEYAVCKHYNCAWLGKYFEGANWKHRTLDTAVGEVRSTFRPGLEGGMRLYPEDDRIEAPYIWVNLRKLGTTIIQAKLVGWKYHRDGRRSEWWNDNSKYWIVPKACLEDMNMLPMSQT